MGVSIPAEGHDPHYWAEQSDFRSNLKDAMTGLTDLQAQVISLKFGSELSNAEVAEIMNRTEGAIKALQYSALQNLNKLLTSKGYHGSEDE